MPLIENITEWILNRSLISTLEIGTAFLRWADGNAGSALIHNFRVTQTPGLKFTDMPDGYEIAIENLGAAIRSLANIKFGLEKYVSLIIPDQAFHFGVVSMPAAAGKAGILPLLERDLQKNAPLTYNSYSIRFESSKVGNNKLNVQYCALPLRIQEDLESACEHAGVIPVSMQPSFACLYKLLCQHPNLGEHTSVFLHIGNERTTMGVFGKAGLRTVLLIDFGIKKLLEALTNALNCDSASATRQLFNEPLLLEDPAATQAQHDIPAFVAIENTIAEFLQQVYGQLLLFTSENSEETGFSRIFLSGGGALIKNLDKLIAYNLGIATSPISYGFEQSANQEHLSENGPFEVVAPVLGNLLLQPVKRDRFDRVMAA